MVRETTRFGRPSISGSSEGRLAEFAVGLVDDDEGAGGVRPGGLCGVVQGEDGVGRDGGAGGVVG